MSPVSANSTALPTVSRRHLALGALPAAFFASASAFANANVAPGDGKLLELERHWRVAVAMADAADRKRDDVAARYDAIMPREPREIVWREEDVELFGGDFKLRPDLDHGGSPARRFFDGYRTIETLDAVLTELRGLDYPMAASAKVGRGIARIEQILSAHSAWRVKVDECWHSSGMHAAERDFDAANDRVAELRRRIAATPATSLTGIMVKARVGSDCFGDAADEVASALRILLDEDESGTGEALAYSILADLVRLSGTGTMIGGANA